MTDIWRSSGVYLLTNRVNGKLYVGSTTQSFLTRWNNGRGYGTKNPIGAAIRKYGWENFTKTILKICPPCYTLAYEQIYLDYYRPWCSVDRGYNIRKLSNVHWLPRTCSLSHRESISRAMKGRKLSAEHKERISLANKGQPKTSAHTERVRLTKRGIITEHIASLRRPVEMIDCTTGEVLLNFTHAADAAVFVSTLHNSKVISAQMNIGKMCRSGGKYRGYYWQYA